MVHPSVSCSLSGMLRHHVTALSAIFVCNLLLTSAQSAPNAALMKLLAANQAQAVDRDSPSSFLHHSNYPASQPSSPNDVNRFWLNSDLDDHNTSGESLEAETEVEDQDIPAKRFHPSAFFGSRGKRTYSVGDVLAKRFHNAFMGSRGKRGPAGEGEENMSEAMVKRFDPNGFSGSRGKRYMPGLEALLLSQMFQKLNAEKWKRQSLLGFHAARG